MLYDVYLRHVHQRLRLPHLVYEIESDVLKLFIDQECFAVSINAKSTHSITQVTFCRLHETVYRHTHTHNVNFLII